MTDTSLKYGSSPRAYIVTGPTSGMGRRAALALAKYGPVILVGRDLAKLQAVQKTIERKGQRAVSVVCDLSDPASVARAAQAIKAIDAPIAGLLNNAGIMQSRQTKNAQGWDMSFATNHLGPFAMTQALAPALPDGAKVLFVVSAVEDPERKPAVAAGFRGGRYISAQASARGEWTPGGSARPGFDAYATSKQAILAAAFAFARETPRLNVSAIEPGLMPTTGLGGADASGSVRFVKAFVAPLLVPLLMPFIKILSTPERAARVITKIMTNQSARTGAYYDEGGHPMQGSALVRDPQFQDRVVTETRALLATVKT